MKEWNFVSNKLINLFRNHIANKKVKSKYGKD